MVGERQRRVASVYQRSQPIDGTGDKDLQMPLASSGRRGSNRRRRRQEEQPPPPQEEERVVTPEDEDEDEDEEAAGDTSSELPSVYLRGTASLPQRRYLLIDARILHPMGKSKLRCYHYFK
jgi:hypothetical protein